MLLTQETRDRSLGRGRTRLVLPKVRNSGGFSATRNLVRATVGVSRRNLLGEATVCSGARLTCTTRARRQFGPRRGSSHASSTLHCEDVRSVPTHLSVVRICVLRRAITCAPRSSGTDWSSRNCVTDMFHELNFGLECFSANEI
jgi:hypothetical protein